MPGIKPTTFSTKQATRLRTVRSLELGDRYPWNRACKIWDHIIKLGPLTFCSFWSGYSFPNRAPVGVLWPNHLCPTSSRHLCHGHRGKPNNGGLIQVMRLWHHGKCTTNNWRNLSNQNGGIKIAFRGCQVPKSGILPQVRKNMGRGSEILTSVIWPAFPAIHKRSYTFSNRDWHALVWWGRKGAQLFLYLPIARSCFWNKHLIRITRVSWGSSRHQGRPAMAFPALAGPVHSSVWGKSGRALLGTLRPSASSDICWTSNSVDSLLQRLNACLVVLDVALKGGKNIQSHLLNY